VTSGARPAIRLAVDEEDQLPRLRRFREEHPDVVIGTLGHGGAWQAHIREEGGGAVVTRWHLRDFLDEIESRFPPRDADGG
jgi:hypothetical protein